MAQPQAASQPTQAPPQAVNGVQFSSTSLYVGDLEPNVSEAQLYEIFSQVGPVVSIRVCRDLITRRSLGYSYVNYNNAQDASRALDLLNFTPVNGKAIRIMFSHRDPSLRKSGAANIFIKSLDKGIDNKALHDTFSAFGPILSCKVATDLNGQSKGYGFVQFEQEDAAQVAIEKVNGMLLNDKQVFVGPFIRRQERQHDAGSAKFSNVYIKNLADVATEEQLKEIFSAYGNISSAVVMRDLDGKSRGFGFVNFESSEDASKACDALNGKVFDDKEWYVGRAQKKSEREAELRNKFEQDRKDRMEKYEGVNLYLKNLDDTVDDEKLRELFAEFGAITSCKVMKDPAGQSKGAGFVAFSSPEEATRAVTEMNGKMMGTKPIYVALAQRKEERRARLQAQFQQRMAPAGVAGGAAPASVPMYHPGAPNNLGQQIFYGQPPPGLIPPQPAGFGYQQQMLGIRPGGGQMPNYFVPAVRGNRNNFRYAPNVRNMPDGQGPPGGPQGMQPGGPMSGAMLPVPIDIQGGAGGQAPEENAQPVPISALASALASAGPEQQRAVSASLTPTLISSCCCCCSGPRPLLPSLALAFDCVHALYMLGEQLYPLVDQLEHDHAGKVTGMLLEMDQTEVLHLIESPEALKSKVNEAMEVLRMASQAPPAPPTDQLAGLALSEAQAA
eukprot:jgi/Mesen1/8686/ME000516S08007